MTKKPQKPSKKQVSDEDRALWQRIAKTITPYDESSGKRNLPPEEKRHKPLPDATSASKSSKNLADGKTTAKTFLASSPSPAAKPLDKETAAKLRRKRLPLEGQLDLHGMTQEKAYQAFMRFIRAAEKSGKRNLLIITGKGRLSDGGGILRRLLPLWLEEPSLRKIVIGFSAAGPKDGGNGAFYLRLKSTAKKK